MSNATLRLITQPSDTLHLMDIPYDTTYVAIRPRYEDPVEDPVEDPLEDPADNSNDNPETDSTTDSTTNSTPTLTHYEIQVGPPTDFTKIWVMATYSSLKIATYAFDLMLQTAFNKEEMFFQFPTEDAVLEFINSEQELEQKQESEQESEQEQKLEQKQDNKYLN